MSVAIKQDDSIHVVFIDQKNEEIEEVTVNSAQLTALLNSKHIWIEKFGENLKTENTIWSYNNDKITFQVYLK